MNEKHFYEVLVGNIGKTWEGSNGFQANVEYNQWVGKSKRGEGRAAGENITLWKDNEIIKEHEGEYNGN
jgi:hypothetical protein